MILGSGTVVGVMLGLATMVVTRWGRPWFGISLSVVVGVMMVAYVAIPSRLIGVKQSSSRRNRLTTVKMSAKLLAPKPRATAVPGDLPPATEAGTPAPEEAPAPLRP
ncbi:MAG: hypothetical protein ACLPZR_29095 [Solirubrobacteraceae bacterium]